MEQKVPEQTSTCVQGTTSNSLGHLEQRVVWEELGQTSLHPLMEDHECRQGRGAAGRAALSMHPCFLQTVTLGKSF